MLLEPGKCRHFTIFDLVCQFNVLKLYRQTEVYNDFLGQKVSHLCSFLAFNLKLLRF